MLRIMSLVSALVLAAAAQAQTRTNATFDIYLRGVKGAQLVFSAIEEGGRYSAAARMRSSGMLGWVTALTYEAQAQGTVRNGDFVPRVYQEERNKDGRVRTARMAYRNGVPQGRELSPPRPPRPGDIDPATQGGTWDVMTAIFAVFREMPREQVCDLQQALFDGRRVSRITLGQPEASGDEITCDAEYRRVAGYSDADMAEGVTFPFRLTFEPAGAGLWHVTRVDMDTIYGRGRMIRR